MPSIEDLSRYIFAFLSNKQTHTCSIPCHCSFKCRRRRLKRRRKKKREKTAHTHTQIYIYRNTHTQQKTGEKSKMNSSQLRDGESNVAGAYEKIICLSNDEIFCRKIYI